MGSRKLAKAGVPRTPLYADTGYGSSETEEKRRYNLEPRSIFLLNTYKLFSEFYMPSRLIYFESSVLCSK